MVEHNADSSALTTKYVKVFITLVTVSLAILD